MQDLISNRNQSIKIVESNLSEIRAGLNNSDLVSIRKTLLQSENGFVNTMIFTPITRSAPLKSILTTYHDENRLHVSHSVPLYFNGVLFGQMAFITYVSEASRLLFAKNWVAFLFGWFAFFSVLSFGSFRIGRSLQFLEELIAHIPSINKTGSSLADTILKDEESFVNSNFRNQPTSLKYLIDKFESALKDLIKLHRSVAVELVLVEVSRKLAHDIRSPLSALNLALGSGSGVSTEQAEIAKMAVARINAIADDLLDSDRESFRTVLQFKGGLNLPNGEFSAVSDLVGQLQNVTEETKFRYQNESLLNLELRAENCDSTGMVPLRTATLGRIFSNILNNAVEARLNKDRPHDVKIVVKVANSELIVCVSDNGTGISSDRLNKISHTRILSLKKDKQNKGGSGIGLLAARQTLEQIGGRLQIFSNIDQGTQVQMWLPIDA